MRRQNGASWSYKTNATDYYSCLCEIGDIPPWYCNEDEKDEIEDEETDKDELCGLWTRVSLKIDVCIGGDDDDEECGERCEINLPWRMTIFTVTLYLDGTVKPWAVFFVRCKCEFCEDEKLR